MSRRDRAGQRVVRRVSGLRLSQHALRDFRRGRARTRGGTVPIGIHRPGCDGGAHSDSDTGIVAHCGRGVGQSVADLGSFGERLSRGPANVRWSLGERRSRGAATDLDAFSNSLSRGSTNDSRAHGVGLARSTTDVNCAHRDGLLYCTKNVIGAYRDGRSHSLPHISIIQRAEID